MRNVDLQSPVHVTADWLSAERSQTGFAKDPVPVKLECALAALGLLTHAPPLIIYDPPGHLNRNFKNATVLFYLHLLRHGPTYALCACSVTCLPLYSIATTYA